MKIIKFTAENIKKLKVVEITPDGSVVQITGPNGSGKSSVLDAIFYALAGTADLPSQPVRQGELKASVRLDLGEVVVTRRFTAAGGTSLTVEAANGARFPSPQTMLDALLGRLAFDPLAFSHMAPAAQLEALRAVVPLAVDVAALDRANETDFNERTLVNRDVKRLEAQLPPSIEPPVAPVDVAALLGAMGAAEARNAALADARRAHERAVADCVVLHDRAAQALEKAAALRRDGRQQVARLSARALDLRKQAEQLETEAANLQAESERKVAEFIAEADALDNDAGKREAGLSQATFAEPEDLAPLRDRIAQAGEANQRFQAQQERVKLLARLESLRKQAADLTAALARREAEKRAAIAAAPMPLPGLTFGRGEVLLNDLPLAQAGDAERLRVSVAIAMAANPKLRVIRIKDGSLLDDNGMALLARMAEAQDYQVWIERVDTSGKVGVVMEDGHVKT